MSGSESPPAKRRLMTVAEVDVQAAEQASVPTKIKEATDFWLRVFSSFCKENNQNVDLTTFSPKDVEAQWPIGYGVGLRIKRSSVRIRPWPLRCVLGQGSLLPLSQGEAFTLASISYLAILVKYIVAKKKKRPQRHSLPILHSARHGRLDRATSRGIRCCGGHYSFCFVRAAVKFRLDKMSGSESPPAKRRLMTVAEVDVQAAEQASVPTKIKEATDFWLRVFSSFCKENDQNVDLTTCSHKDLNDIHCRFYIGMRTQKGDYYVKASYLAATAALSRYFVTVLHRAECNVFRYSVFKQSNVVLDGVLKKKKAVGLEPKPEHKAAICTEDLVKLNSYFEDVLDAADPMKLTYFCWFHLTLHFALRGAEVQIQLKKQDIVFEVNPTSKEYVSLKWDFLAKNCAGGVDGRESQSCGRLQDPVQVAAIKKLLTKLHPEVDRVFQRALPGVQEEEKPTWFAKMPLGHGVVGNMLLSILSAAQVSKRYTDHCVRATSIVLRKAQDLTTDLSATLLVTRTCKA